MHISIEGMDGSGKTSTAKKIAEMLGFEFVEKPLHLITDENDQFDNYMKIVERVNSMEPGFRARFYGLGNYLVSRKAKEGGVVTDRHLASNYYWNCVGDDEFFGELVSDCGAPEFTFVLYVSADERRRRITSRNPNDPDLVRNVFDDLCYEKMEHFLISHRMNYYFIESDSEGLDEVVQEIVGIIKSKTTLTKSDNGQSSI